MKKKGTYLLGIFIMAFGGILLLAQLGINVGWIISLIIPTYFLYKGWKLFTKSDSSMRKGFGVVLIAVGALWLTGMLPVIIGLVIAGCLIYYGMKMVENHKAVAFSPEMAMSEHTSTEPFFTAPTTYSNDAYDELDEWEKQIKKNN